MFQYCLDHNLIIWFTKGAKTTSHVLCQPTQPKHHQTGSSKPSSSLRSSASVRVQTKAPTMEPTCPAVSGTNPSDGKSIWVLNQKYGKTTQIIHLFTGFTIIFTIHFGGFYPYFWKHPFLPSSKLTLGNTSSSRVHFPSSYVSLL